MNASDIQAIENVETAREMCDAQAYFSGQLCVQCGVRSRRPNDSYCLKCHARHMREWRKTHPLTPEQRRKDKARSYANAYQHRGKLIPEPCSVCGTLTAEKHHSDYNRPLAVEWLCRPCHLSLHKLVGAEYDAESFKDAIADMRAVVQAAKVSL